MANALSRREEKNSECMAIIEVTPVWIREVMTSYQGDREAQAKITALLLDSNSEPDYHYLNGLLKYKTRVYISSSGDMTSGRS